MEGQYQYNKYKAEKAVEVLIADARKISSVEMWAEKVYKSPDWLRKLMRKIYGKSPKQIHREIRFETVFLLIKEQGWEANADGVAIDSGIGKNCKALHKFLRRHYGITFTELKEGVLTGDIDVSCAWLNN